MPDQKSTSNTPSDKPISREENARTGWAPGGPPGPDAYMKQQAMARLNKDHRPAATGNLADLDRLGGLALGQSPTDAFQLPPGFEKADVTTPAERDAALGIYNTETARTGLVDAPEAYKGGDGHVAAVVRDPGSQSPEVVSSPGKSTSGTTSKS